MKGDLLDRVLTCAFCPKLCRYDCQVSSASAKENLHPTAKAGNILLSLKGRGGAADLIPLLLRCSGCLRCREFCRHEIDFSDVSRSLLDEFYREGKCDQEAEGWREGFLTSGNPHGQDIRKRYEGLVPEDLRVEGARACLFPGCSAVIGEGLIDSWIHLFHSLDIDFVAWPREFACCGHPLFTAGFFDDFRRMGGKLLSRLRGYSLVIAPCPECLYTIKFLYPSLGLASGARVVSAQEFLLDRIQKAGREGGVMVHSPPLIHDPCYAGRHLSLYEPQRALLGAFTGQDPMEPPFSGRNSLCCGGGGHLPFLFPELSLQMGRRLAASIEFSGSGVLVTPCPSCRNQLKGLKGKGFEVYELGEYLGSGGYPGKDLPLKHHIRG